MDRDRFPANFAALKTEIAHRRSIGKKINTQIVPREVSIEEARGQTKIEIAHDQRFLAFGGPILAFWFFFWILIELNLISNLNQPKSFFGFIVVSCFGGLFSFSVASAIAGHEEWNLKDDSLEVCEVLGRLRFAKQTFLFQDLVAIRLTQVWQTGRRRRYLVNGLIFETAKKNRAYARGIGIEEGRELLQLFRSRANCVIEERPL